MMPFCVDKNSKSSVSRLSPFDSDGIKIILMEEKDSASAAIKGLDHQLTLFVNSPSAEGQQNHDHNHQEQDNAAFSTSSVSSSATLTSSSRPASYSSSSPVNNAADSVGKEIDPWALPEFDTIGNGTPWTDLTALKKCQRCLYVLIKVTCLFTLLYLFICSLGLLSDSFRLLGGKTAGQVLGDSKLLRNPIAGLMMGVLGTVLLQSSSTSTSIVVGLVASDMLTVRQAIPIIMGANIGTSITNTIVSVGHSGKRAEFRRAFAGATVHDMFNWLCVLILLPVEVTTGYLYRLTGYLISVLALGDIDSEGVNHKRHPPPKLLKRLTEPLTRLVVQLDKSKISALARGTYDETLYGDSGRFSLIQRNCAPNSNNRHQSLERVVSNSSGFSQFFHRPNAAADSYKRCDHLLAYVDLSDTLLGTLLLAVSLLFLVFCLVLIVKLLNSMLRGRMAKTIRKRVNNDLPGRLAPFTAYFGICIGALMTILV